MALFDKALCKAMNPSNIKSAFRTTGIFPFNSQAALPSKQVFNPKSLNASTGLAYIPLYSPHKSKQQHLRESEPASPQHTCERFDATNDASAGFESDQVFSEQEEVLYRTRLEEGYDLYDYRYDQWSRKQSHDIRDDFSRCLHLSSDEEESTEPAPE